MRLVFAGTPSAAVPSLAALLESSHDVVAVVTRPDAPSGRGRKLTQSPVWALAASAGIEILAPAKPGDPSFLDQLAKLRPDCCPVVAYGSLLPRAALDIPLHGWVNLHFSLLPAWRGAAPVQRALMAGDEVTGATTFRIVEALDAGPTYGQVSEAVRADDTSGALLDRLSLAGAALLVATLDGIEDGTAEATPQPPDGVTLAPKLTVADAEVSWGLPALAVDRCIRACTPAPGAWTTSGQGRLKLAPVVTRADVTSLAPGELAAGKDAVLVGTATDAVQLTSVQPPGKAWMSAPDWVRGQRAVTGRLGR